MKKPTLALLSAACLAAMTLTACNNDRNDRDDTVMAGDTAAAADGTDTTMGDDTAMGTGTGTADAMDGTGATNADNASAPAAERSALGVLNAINEHEIAAGKQAQSKGVSGDVAAYAQRMIDEHTRNRDTTSGFGPMPTTPMPRRRSARARRNWPRWTRRMATITPRPISMRW
jgi:Predicted outer membrane protein